MSFRPSFGVGAEGQVSGFVVPDACFNTSCFKRREELSANHKSRGPDPFRVLAAFVFGDVRSLVLIV